MRTLNADLLTSQVSGYPTGGYQPAVRCILTSKDGATTYDYSFNPTVTTNRLQYAQQIEERESGSGVLLLNNHDRAIPTDLTGYYVDLGWGHNTVSGVKWDATDGAVAPRLWIMTQQAVSGGQKNQLPQLCTLFELQSVWAAVLNVQPLRLGTSPFYQDETGLLAGMTIYACLEYLIETALTAQTGITFTLDAIGTQDDGLISTIIPFPVVTSGSFVVGTTYRIKTVGTTNFVTEQLASANTVGVLFVAQAIGTGTGTATGPPLVKLNGTPGDLTGAFGDPTTPGEFETYGTLIYDLLNLTKCFLRPKAVLSGLLPFEVIWPQASDAVKETYYSSQASGHPFYEVTNVRLNAAPNSIEIYGGENVDTGKPTVVGYWYDPDHYDGATPATHPQNYDGSFMPVQTSRWYEGLTTVGECNTEAAIIGRDLRDKAVGARVIIPMDARVELYDRVEIDDQRGH